jgi:TRAP-type C4-dicarboxylate transport system permease small subunit
VIGRIVKTLEWGCLTLSALAIFAMMVIVSLDVGFRYALNSPIPWAFDLISMYLMVAIFFLTLSASYAFGHHIRIDLLTRSAPPARKAWLRRLEVVLVAPLFCVIAWLAAQQSMTSYESGLVISGPIPWPTWPGPALVAVGSTLLLARLLVQFVDPLGDAMDPADQPIGES